MEKFHSTERLSCASRGIDSFSVAQLREPYSVGKLSIIWTEICIFSRTGCKTKILERSNLFSNNDLEVWAARGIDIFILIQLHNPYTIGNSRLGEKNMQFQQDRT